MSTAPTTSPNWWSRNWKWFVPVLIVTAIALIGGFILAILTFVMRMMSSSEPYQTAVARAQADPAVVAALGEPVSPGRFTMGEIETNNDSGTAKLSIPLSGPKGEARLHVYAERETGQWNYDTMVVVVDDSSTRIDLLEGDAATPAASHSD